MLCPWTSRGKRPPPSHPVNTLWQWQPRTERPPLRPPSNPCCTYSQASDGSGGLEEGQAPTYPWNWATQPERSSGPRPGARAGSWNSPGQVRKGMEWKWWGWGVRVGMRVGEKEGTNIESRIQGPDTCPLCYQTSLTKHKSKDEIINNVKTVTKEHQTQAWGPSENWARYTCTTGTPTKLALLVAQPGGGAL